MWRETTTKPGSISGVRKPALKRDPREPQLLVVRIKDFSSHTEPQQQETCLMSTSDAASTMPAESNHMGAKDPELGQRLSPDLTGDHYEPSERVTAQYQPEYGKTLVAFLLLWCSAFMNFFLLTIIHDIVPQKPLPDLAFILIPQQK